MLTALLLSLSILTPGDVAVVLRTPIADLDSPRKQKLANSITAVFPTADTSTVQKFYCSLDVKNKNPANRLDVWCDGEYKDRVSESKFADLSIAEEVREAYEGAPEGQVDFLRIAKSKKANTVARPVVKDFVETVFLGTNIDIILDFTCKRDIKDQAKIFCWCTYFDQVGPATYVTLLHAKYVVRAIRRVQ